ncbi:hypothetical protein GMAR_ORF217 [Golden Marseillevirus]|uniref:hypothetical protein n=1 Tax=Golden Marseillevirus TaxID=1720526 RepID=UPI000877ADE2|nr:hypothetical protein GMAR_ORF217 [Golden Marseillevirus]ALX27591.1 hypothetical protein GMAR_ORF217 [Golden Marseillevirus]
MMKVCSPAKASATDLLEVVKQNNERIRVLKEEVFREDSEFCIFCMKYLFTDTPDFPIIMCDCCAHCFCDPCSKTLGIYEEDGIAVEGACPTCYLGIPNDLACGGNGSKPSSSPKPLWCDDSTLSLTVPVWRESSELNTEKGHCAVCYLDITTYYGKKKVQKKDGKVFCRICKEADRQL